MEKTIMNEFGDGYYDGIPQDILKMSPEEIDKAIEIEERRCEKLNADLQIPPGQTRLGGIFIPKIERTDDNEKDFD